MHKVVTVEMEKDILAENRHLADHNRALLDEHGIRGFDFLGAIGSGKTLIIEKLVDRLKSKGKRAAAIAGDVSGDDDYQRFVSHGIPAANINTGKECHLDAHLVDHALDDLPLEELDYLFIENVGNLVCPVDFPVGSHARAALAAWKLERDALFTEYNLTARTQGRGAGGAPGPGHQPTMPWTAALRPATIPAAMLTAISAGVALPSAARRYRPSSGSRPTGSMKMPSWRTITFTYRSRSA